MLAAVVSVDSDRIGRGYLRTRCSLKDLDLITKCKYSNVVVYSKEVHNIL